jgi:hypothetical protein
MALRTLHPCDFGFTTSNIRILGASVSGGTSLSGFEDVVQADGGGYRAADLTNGSARTREQNLAIRAFVDEVGTTQAFTALLCVEKHFQPVLGRPTLSMHDWNKPIADGAPDKGAAYIAGAAAALRATTMAITGTSEIALVGGELFSINHPTWGWRVYRVTSFDGSNITFRTPLREAVTTGTPLEFDVPRCQMKLAQAPDLSTDQGLRTTLALSLIEDMSKPVS